MSVIIISSGGGGHQAITRLVLSSMHASAQWQADAVNLLQKFVDDANVLCDEIDNSTPLPK